MAKEGATISKILKETKSPRGTAPTILREYRLRGNVQNVVVDLQRQRQETITYDVGLHVL